MNVVTAVTRKRSVSLAATVAIVAAGAVASTACLIGDSPADLPAINFPPVIGQDPIPSNDAVLISWPPVFQITVNRVDESTPYQWKFLIDYDPSASMVAENDPYALPQPPPIGNGNTVRISPPEPITGGCHVLIFVVATSFDNASSELPTGGSSMTWFYSRGGDLAGCPVYPDTADAAFPDGNTDGGDGATE